MFRITAIALLSFALSVLPSLKGGAAQDSATVDSVLAKSIEALGGKAALEKVKTRYVKGEMEMSAMSLKGPWEVWAKAPNKQLSHVEIAGGGITDEGFDGKVAWAKGPGGAVREKAGEELAKVIRDADFHRELNVQKLYPDIAYKGTEQFQGEEVSVLESRPSGTSKERFSFSNKTGLMVRQESEFDIGQGKVRLDLRLLDHKPHEGIQFPRRISGHINVADQELEFIVRISEVRFNAPVDDSRFAKPAA